MSPHVDLLLQLHKAKSDINTLQREKENVQWLLIEEQEKVQNLYKCKNSPYFCIEHFENKNEKILYYTGVQNHDIFECLFNFLLPSETADSLKIFSNADLKLKQHASRLTPKNQFFMTLMRLRRGFEYETLADMFGISKASVGKIFLGWINHIYIKLGSLKFWPHRDIIIQNALPEFTNKYPRVIGFIDCTEFYIQKPSSLVTQSQCYSQYKNSTTLKSLIMTDPNGYILFASPLFTGSISDKQIIIKSNYLKTLKRKIENGEIQHYDRILADKGFNVADLFADINLELNIPTFRITGMQFSESEVQNIRTIAHERIHIEHTIRRLKSFKLLKNEIPISFIGTIEQCYIVCCLLNNFRYPLRKPNTDSFSSIEENVSIE